MRGIPFKSNLQSVHVVRPLLLEALFQGYSHTPDPLEAPSEKIASLEEELAKVRGELAECQRINVLLNNEKKKLTEYYLGLHKKHEEVTSQWDKLKEESSGFDIQITQLSGYRDVAIAEASRTTQEAKPLEDEVKCLEDVTSQHPKELWAAVENFKQSAEFKGALSATVDVTPRHGAPVERFKKSPEFLDTLGVNAAYGAYIFVRKYREKYPDLHCDYQEFQEDYNSSWFTELSLDAPSEEEDEEEEEEGAPLANDAAPKA
ncbi:hypothetical protein LIER_33605 [Lithospermum erythrorhizon]|uniref:Uncharacterized protein n=1 Tax=Lithospermum erythrorhizon TaxID=34254 RepID=A0AAV3S170_LITER